MTLIILWYSKIIQWGIPSPDLSNVSYGQFGKEAIDQLNNIICGKSVQLKMCK